MRFKVICIALAASAYYLPLSASDGGSAESYFDHEIYRFEDQDSYHDHHREVTKLSLSGSKLRK